MATTLPFVAPSHDPFDDETHKSLDELVVSEVPDEPSTIGTAAALLYSVVNFSQKKLNPRYCDFQHAKDLLKEHPGLQEMLKVAWQEQSFRDIRRLRESSHRWLSSLVMRNLARTSPIYG
jgi:hypothetical protein